MLNFLIVDDHEIVRAGVKNVLQITFQPDSISEASNELTTKELLLQKVFDLIIMDVQMPNTDTIGLVKYIRTQYPDSKLLMFSMTPEKIYANKFYNEGVMGFVSKSAGLNELSKAIDLVLNGRKYFSESFLEHLAQGNTFSRFENPFTKLSSREMEVTMELMKGVPIASIALNLAINSSTLASHKAHIFQKLDVSNVGELIAIGKLHNIITE
jgi:two-component system invasion response regulator UvrY